MAPAVETLRAAAAEVAASDPAVLRLDATATARRWRRAAISSTCSSIRSPRRCAGISAWSSFADAGVSGIVELSPAGTLVGLAKRALRGVPTVAVKTPADLDAATALVAVDA